MPPGELKAEKDEIVRFLSDAEREALLAACRSSKRPRLYLLMLTALTTVARRDELEGPRWLAHDFDCGEGSIERSKNGDRKMLVLVPAVVDEMRRFVGAAAALVFPSKRRPDVADNFDPPWTAA